MQYPQAPHDQAIQGTGYGEPKGLVSPTTRKATGNKISPLRKQVKIKIEVSTNNKQSKYIDRKKKSLHRGFARTQNSNEPRKKSLETDTTLLKGHVSC